jgi:hypothetical protein
MQDEYLPFVESDAKAGTEALRAEMDERGYLFFRGIVPADEVLAVRRDVLTLCAEAGWLDPARDLMDGVMAPGMQPTMEGQPEYMAVYRRILKQTPRFHDFPLHPGPMVVAAGLLSVEPEQVLVHFRRIGRVTFPNLLSATTPAHQDHFYIRGAVDTYSCWAPLGDCSMELGGLAVAPGSHRAGFLEHTAKFPGAVGGRGVPTEDIAEWHTTDFRAGDALFFHAFAIHKALPNQTADRLRISTDNRYQREGDAIEPGALRTHFDL